MQPETGYARLGDLHLAYQVLGEGPPDILLLDQWFGNVEAQWDVPPMATLRERLTSFGRLIMFDKRGTGLSDPIPTSARPRSRTGCWQPFCSPTSWAPRNSPRTWAMRLAEAAGGARRPGVAPDRAIWRTCREIGR
jgi:hypothetical protein